MLLWSVEPSHLRPATVARLYTESPITTVCTGPIVLYRTRSNDNDWCTQQLGNVIVSRQMLNVWNPQTMRSLVIDWRVCVESHSTDTNGVDETHAANRLSNGLTYDGYQYRTAVFYTKLLFIVCCTAFSIHICLFTRSWCDTARNRVGTVIGRRR